MKIVHNSLDAADIIMPAKATKVKADQKKSDHEEAMRAISYMYFKKALRKYKKEIEEIQEYFPGWMPEFETK